MEKTIWDIIRESRTVEPYTIASTQYENLVRILSEYDKETVKKFYSEWNEKARELLKNEKKFDKLHCDYGGIVDSGDDGFYMDFANWVIAQGEELFNAYKSKRNGYKAILQYINELELSDTEYRFECMIYVFPEVLESK